MIKTIFLSLLAFIFVIDANAQSSSVVFGYRESVYNLNETKLYIVQNNSNIKKINVDIKRRPTGGKISKKYKKVDKKSLICLKEYILEKSKGKEYDPVHNYSLPVVYYIGIVHYPLGGMLNFILPLRYRVYIVGYIYEDAINELEEMITYLENNCNTSGDLINALQEEINHLQSMCNPRGN